MPEQNLENINPLESPSSAAEQMHGVENIPEKSSESKPERSIQASQEKNSNTSVSVSLPNAVGQEPVSVSNQEIVLKKVENILASGMEQAFLTMDVATQAKFKIKGEETAKKISTLMQKSKLKAKEVVNLILEWLRIIPKVNKFYIEQEAKIKTDHIMRVYDGKE